jgi:hypothetical protein
LTFFTTEKAFADDLDGKKRTSEYLADKYYKKLSDFGVCITIKSDIHDKL